MGGTHNIHEERGSWGIVGLNDAGYEGLRAATPATRVDTYKYEYFIRMYSDQYVYIIIADKYHHIYIYSVAHFWFLDIGFQQREVATEWSSGVGGLRMQFLVRGCRHQR